MLQNTLLPERGTQCHGSLYTHPLEHVSLHAHMHSLDAFIVSDSEEVESDSDGEGPNENHTPWKVPLAMPSYSTPYTRVALCGSPDVDDSITTKPTTQLYTPKPICRPLGERNHAYCSTPVAGWY